MWFCHAYCLMENHDHLLIETPEGNVLRGMRQFNGVLTQHVNQRYGQGGICSRGASRRLPWSNQ